MSKGLASNKEYIVSMEGKKFRNLLTVGQWSEVGAEAQWQLDNITVYVSQLRFNRDNYAEYKFSRDPKDAMKFHSIETAERVSQDVNGTIEEVVLL